MQNTGELAVETLGLNESPSKKEGKYRPHDATPSSTARASRKARPRRTGNADTLEGQPPPREPGLNETPSKKEGRSSGWGQVGGGG